MTENQDHNYTELNQDISEREPIEIESSKKMLIGDELKAMLLKEADSFERYETVTK